MAGERILVVDDNLTNLKLVRLVLTKHGYAVCTATDAAEALVALQTFHPRLILMDLQLPGVDGLVLTRLLKADPATRAIPIVALTAHAMKGDEEKARGAGCDAYVAKPIDIHVLRDVVAKHLGEGTPSGDDRA